ncbi:helix-turn-helix transcriptional regulator [Streptomyces phaeolivaceus]|uniref:Helix-turn-helix transcriptional regulator n=1 Tax=Streptomyces phaeolivaceus TaxID=2653200 RepID=A0A5P8K2R2_9ACTN|nr:helix-turn-helix transcriptional regulator [Streptomyces phaeolivaceus]QFQ97324.1 helix-turn-helix transcriptional regulator [Streptomyces phaeolivaceus]
MVTITAGSLERAGVDVTVVLESAYIRVRSNDDGRWRTPNPWGTRVHDEQTGPEQALAELRRRLEDGLARSRWSKTQLAAKAELARTTVYEAMRSEAPVPSPETVAALAQVLKLPVAVLLELRRHAATPIGPDAGDVLAPGRPLSEWDPHDLEVHPAGDAAGCGVPGQRVLPGYVRREHDETLTGEVREAAAGNSRMVVLVGTSSTGKTRACWQAVQPLADLGWRLWHPFDPTRADAALASLNRVGPKTVVWLNEAQHYLGDAARGEHIAAALHTLITDRERAPVLILGTLWKEYADRYTTLPSPGGPDPHSRARELLSRRRVPVPDTFDETALAAARSLAAAGDRQLADALTRADGHGRLAQDLAGAPELLRRYEDGSPPARALLQAAMDARRLGVGLHLPQAFLTDAAPDYLTDADYQGLTEDWAEVAYAELAKLVHGKQAPLSRIRQRPLHRPPAPQPSAPSAPAGLVFRLADYLEQHGRATRRVLCPPASFWHAAHKHLTHPDDLQNLAHAAGDKHRIQ